MRILSLADKEKLNEEEVTVTLSGRGAFLILVTELSLLSLFAGFFKELRV